MKVRCINCSAFADIKIYKGDKLSNHKCSCGLFVYERMKTNFEDGANPATGTYMLSDNKDINSKYHHVYVSKHGRFVHDISQGKLIRLDSKNQLLKSNIIAGLQKRIPRKLVKIPTIKQEHYAGFFEFVSSLHESVTFRQKAFAVNSDVCDDVIIKIYENEKYYYAVAQYVDDQSQNPMTFKQYVDKLNHLLKSRPELGELQAVYAGDQSGNQTFPVYFCGTVGYFDGNYEFTDVGSYKALGIKKNQTNAVCIN